MNARSFKVIFSKRLGALVAVGENTASQGKGACGEGARGVVVEAASALSYVGALKTLCLAALVGTMPKAFALDANALPTGGEVRHGAATVGSEGATMTINQTSSRATINWQSFNVGSGAKVNIVQPSSSAALLNRVVGNEMSQIHGQINANGQVVLVNPNGVLVGSSGAITASAFTATTFGISDADFESGNLRFTRNGSSASVDNQGSISTSGGYVALIGATVSNSGTISTGGGNALLGAGDAVSIPLGSNIRLELDPAAFASVDNSGTITTDGGQVFMRASAVIDAVSKVANATVTHSGTINSGGGRVDVLADSGTVRVSGAVNAGGASVFIGRDEQTNTLAAVGDASGAQLESQGGFVETSGQFLKVDGARVIAKDWLLDPFNITIGGPTTTAGATGLPSYTPSATSNISVADILTSLNAGTSVKISTGLADSNGNQDGNIDVNASIEKTGTKEATLTLEANNRITIASGIKITDGDTNNLSVHLIANGNGSGSQSFVMGRDSAIDVGGDVTIDVTKDMNGFNEGSAIFMNAGSRLSTDNNPDHTVGRTYIRGKDVNINMTLSGANRMGMFTQHATGIEATGSQLNITSNYTDTLPEITNRRIAVFMGSGWGAGNPTPPASSFLRAENGAITLDNQSSNGGNAGGINLAGTQVTAKKDITFKTSNVRATDNAINIGQEFHVPVVQSREGDVKLLAQQGRIVLGSLGAGAISGKNVVIDNTGADLSNRNSDGNFTKGTGSYTGNNSSALAIQGFGAGMIKATQNLDIIGVGSVAGSSAVTISTGNGSIQGGRVAVQGENVGLNNGSTNGVFASGNIVATNGDVVVIGKSNTDNGLSLHTNITADQNVILDGASGNSTTPATSWGVYLNRAVKATNGNITIKASTTTDKHDLNMDTGSSLQTLAGDKHINIQADTVRLIGTVNAGSTGTVSFTPYSTSTEVHLGVDDNFASGARVLGLSQTELNQITAGELVLGRVDGGNVKVMGNVVTNETTGNLTLQTANNIDFSANLTTGGTTGSKKLSLKSDGTISGTAAGVITTKELDIGSANGTTNPNVALGAATHQISQVSGNVQAFDLKNGRSLIVGASTAGNVLSDGLNAKGNVKIESASSTSGAGIQVKNLIINERGNVTLIGNNTSSTGNGVWLVTDVQAQNGSVSIKGTTSGSGTGVLAQKAIATDSLNIAATKGIVIEGSSASGTGVDLDGGTITQTGNHDFGTGNAIHVKGSTGTDSATLAGVRLNNEMSNWNNTGKIVIEATQGALVSTADAKITQNANANVELSTEQLGDVSAAKINKFGTVAGDIIIAAGKNRAAGDGSGGQVKPIDGNTITNNGTGKLLVYTGNTNDTGVLKHLSSAFDTLHIAGTQTNTGFDRAFGATLTNGPVAQVLFRQKDNLPTVSGDLDPATFNRDYNGQTVAQNGDLTKLKDALKAVNTGNFTNTVGSNTFGVAKADVIDLLALDTAGNGIKNVKRNSSTKVVEAHTLTLDTSAVTNQTTGLTGFSFTNPNAQSVALMIRPLSARVSANATTVTNNGAVQIQTATVEGFLPAEAGGVTVSGLRSESAPGTYNSNVVVSAADADLLGNYDITVTNAALTIAAAPTPAPTPDPEPTPDDLNPYIPPVNPDTAPSDLSGRGSATLIGAGDGFRLASAEAGQCTQDTLEFCECEEAKDDKGLSLTGVQLCFEPKETPKIAL